MLLSDRDIRAQIEDGRLVFDSLGEQAIQPASVDVRLGATFRVFNNHRYASIDPFRVPDDLTTEVVTPPGDAFVLHPGEFVLASTRECVSLPNDISARVEGKSSLGRLGLLTHATAGFVDASFNGHITLELSNVANLPIKLYPGMKIGQLCFFQMTSASQHPYGSEAAGSHYQGQTGPTPSAGL